MLGRGHGFGPHGGGRGRDNRSDMDLRRDDDRPPRRNYGRIANTRPGARAPMEEETYPPGDVMRGGCGSRSRALESGTRDQDLAGTFERGLKR
jgi:hypothetical protein